MRFTRRYFSWMVLAALFVTSFSPVPAAPAAVWQSKVDPWVLETSAAGETEFLVYLAEQADLAPAANLPTRQEKGAFVYRTLYDLAQRSQKPLIAELERMGVAYQSFYIANMVWVRGDNQVLQTLAQRADVAHLYANPHVRLQEPQKSLAPDAPQAGAAIEWNILKVNADDIWAAGYTGQGAVVGGQDTGYDWDHPALINQYRGWDGAAASHDYNWHDAIHSGGGVCGADSPQPCDDDAHGTHTMGTIVGDDGGSNQIGMAPGARWIGCRNMDEGIGTPATYTECYEWFIAPYPLGGTPAQGDPAKAPDVINNSWGCPPWEGCTEPDVLLAVVNNVRAAGILTAHSAGNSGPNCGTVNEPAAIYEASFSVGATDINDAIAAFSSRGPVTIDGSNRLKPNISAPGVNIRSSVPGGGYQSGWSGTSMAAPHVAGLAALLISVDPALSGQVDVLEERIERSALPRATSQNCGGTPGSNIPNNTYGWGRIDALSATQFFSHTLSLQKSTNASAVAPGEAITYTLWVTHTHPALPTTHVVLTDTLPAGTVLTSATAPYTLLGDVVRWDILSLSAGETISRTMVAVTATDATGEVVNAHYGVRSDQVDPVAGSPLTTPIIPLGLEISKIAQPAVAPGGTLTYTLQVVNPHPSAAVRHVVLTDTIPANTTFISATPPYDQGETITWTLPILGPGASWDVQLVVRAPITFTGEIVNEFYGVGGDEIPTRLGAPLTTEIHSLALAKSASASQVRAGDLITYTLTVANQHPSAILHQIVLSDTLPAGTVFVSSDITHTLASGVVTWQTASLAPAGTWEANLTVQVLPGIQHEIENSVYRVASLESPTPVQGEAVSTPVWRTIILPIIIQGLP